MRHPHIKRCVWGYEVAPTTGTPHLQGYLEFKRSYRINICNRLLPRAAWVPAIADARQNYNYCTKSGNFDSIGDWTAGGIIPPIDGRRPATVPLIIAGLLNPTTAAQTRASREYMDNFNYFDRVAKFIAKVKSDNEAFRTWKDLYLYPWQNMVR